MRAGEARTRRVRGAAAPRRASLGGAGRDRLDVLLVERGLFPSRQRGQAAILAGEVYLDGERAESSGTRVRRDATVEVRPRRARYVSRGGLKLEHALAAFGVDVRGKVALDVGASTGGFTDCLLQAGAARVVAVDVGRGQLDWSLRGDPRVVNLERTDIRALASGDLPAVPALAVIDVAFIGVGKVLPAAVRLLAPGGEVIALVKPQFEAGPRAAKRGVVTDPDVHRRVLAAVAAGADAAGCGVAGLTHSPIRGPEGNIEFFMHLAPARASMRDLSATIERVVAEAHAALVPARGGVRAAPPEASR
ncbi:MAG: TlyA family RNA methyltransferase [Armatimonadetes bacterium]|nr:TlyA family RNA methyltransferase [Armatimonadota bacterium]